MNRVQTLPPYADLRQIKYREEVFLRFYDFHTKHGTAPGLVYLFIPALKEKLNWTQEETLWFAFLNGCTQHPITSLRLWRIAPSLAAAHRLLEWLDVNIATVVVDTDRRHHRRAIPQAIMGYEKMLRGANPVDFWQTKASNGWQEVWAAARAIPTFGRLSAWSFCDYLVCAGIPVEPDNLMLDDKAGSKSHRNGLAIVAGQNHLDWHKSNPTFKGTYSNTDLENLNDLGATLLRKARDRASGQNHVKFLTYLTLESALCTYKSFHRRNRRYPNVYADMAHDRIQAAEKWASDDDLALFWDIRKETLPPYLRLENNAGDPGVSKLKQNYYRENGRLPVIGHDYADMWSDFDTDVQNCTFGIFR